ncbi:MAG: 30S ribosomal protein S1 [Thermodesulfobacteriota bacterium]|nr:30S ribosomal protein S1 [Thermodesulfobacteriota bacterium]
MDLKEESAALEEDSDFKELYEKSFRSLKEGEVLQGYIVQIDKESVMVDIGSKSEGRIPLHEFLDENGNLNVCVGDEIEALLVRWEEDDEILLSKDKAAKIKVWDEISRIYNEDGVIEGKIVARVKGGLSVDIGVQAFLPGSQVDLRPVKNLESMVGELFQFKILKYNKRRGNVVLSRRVILEDERNLLKAKTLESLVEGAVMQGVVKNITEYGVFVDLGGIDGLLHITDMSWGRVGHPSELFKVGDTIDVKVLGFDRERERVSLGTKQLQNDPWSTAAEKYPVTSKVHGKVVSLADYGAFVEVAEGVEGLIHVSEMSWTRKIRNPSKLLSVGDIVECLVLNMDASNKRISLGLKQIEPNPWDVVAEKYPVGTTIEGKIKNITDFGIFIGIDEGIDGLVHISDISWTKRYKHPSEALKKGDQVRAVVLNIEKENERFSLGIKQLEPDPWELVPAKYPVGARVTGTVTNITDFGLFVELEEGIEGLVHVSEAGRHKGKSLRELYSLGDVISAKVINVSVGDRKIGLSIKRMKTDEEQSYYSDYTGNRKGAATSNLGEQLQQALLNQAATQEAANSLLKEEDDDVQAVDSDEAGTGHESESDSGSDEITPDMETASDEENK